MPEFKDDFSATLKDAVEIQRRIQQHLENDHYYVGIFGACVSVGKGHDIDIFISDAEGATLTAEQAAEKFKSEIKRLIYFEVQQYDEEITRIYMNFVTHDDFYVDLVLNGRTA